MAQQAIKEADSHYHKGHHQLNTTHSHNHNTMRGLKQTLQQAHLMANTTHSQHNIIKEQYHTLRHKIAAMAGKLHHTQASEQELLAKHTALQALFHKHCPDTITSNLLAMHILNKTHLHTTAKLHSHKLKPLQATAIKHHHWHPMHAP